MLIQKWISSWTIQEAGHGNMAELTGAWLVLRNFSDFPYIVWLIDLNKQFLKGFISKVLFHMQGTICCENVISNISRTDIKMHFGIKQEL